MLNSVRESSFASSIDLVTLKEHTVILESSKTKKYNDWNKAINKTLPIHQPKSSRRNLLKKMLFFASMNANTSLELASYF